MLAVDPVENQRTAGRNRPTSGRFRKTEIESVRQCVNHAMRLFGDWVWYRFDIENEFRHTFGNAIFDVQLQRDRRVSRLVFVSSLIRLRLSAQSATASSVRCFL